MLTHATLSFTYAPTGSVHSLIAFLYVSISGARSSGSPIVKQSAPMPSRPAFSNVAGLPHASQSGGCGTVHGRGSTVRDGIENPSPVVRVRRLAQDAHDLGQRLVEQVAGRVRVGDAEALVLGARRAAPGAELEPAVAQVVEHRHPLGHARRVVHRRREVEDPRAEVDAARSAPAT